MSRTHGSRRPLKSVGQTRQILGRRTITIQSSWNGRTIVSPSCRSEAGRSAVDDDEDYSDIEVAPFDDVPSDPVAARAASFTQLLALIDHIKNEDARKEALLMLRAIRTSFKTLPVGDLTSLPGGKS